MLELTRETMTYFRFLAISRMPLEEAGRLMGDKETTRTHVWGRVCARRRASTSHKPDGGMAADADGQEAPK